MKAIQLVAVGAGPPVLGERSDSVPLELLDELAAALARIFWVSCHLRAEPLDASFAFDPARNQYHATAILQQLESLLPTVDDDDAQLLGVTALDLYVPVLTFVFGEAQLAGRCALVSVHRLGEEFYGLPPNSELLRARLTKEAVHELGHTFGLRHCFDWRCVMASSHSMEWLDVKTRDFCRACRQYIAAGTPGYSPGRS